MFMRSQGQTWSEYHETANTIFGFWFNIRHAHIIVAISFYKMPCFNHSLHIVAGNILPDIMTAHRLSRCQNIAIVDIDCYKFLEDSKSKAG